MPEEGQQSLINLVSASILQSAGSHKPSETGLNSTTLQFVPSSGCSIHTDFDSSPEPDGRILTLYVQAFKPVSLFPVRISKSYLYTRTLRQSLVKYSLELTYAMDKQLRNPTLLPQYRHATYLLRGVDRLIP